MFITEALLLAAFAAVPTEAEVRQVARDALEPLCRGRCDVVEVELRTRPARSGRLDPGFDPPTGGRQELSEVRLGVLFDQALGANFRRFAIERLESRVGELGAPVRITPKVRPFPEPAAPLEAPEAPRPNPPQTVIVQPAPTPPAPEPVVAEPPEPDWATRIFERLLEFLPLLLLFALAAWLVLRLLKRMEDLVFDLRQPPPTPTPEPEKPTPEPEKVPEPAPAELPPPTLEMVATALARHRSSTRRVFRKLLLGGEYDLVARALQLLGEDVVRDIGHDPSLEPALVDAGARAAELLVEPITEPERDQLLRRIDAELRADRLTHRDEDLRSELEPLLGWSPEAFARFVVGLDEPDVARAALRHGPAHLVDAYLRGLSDADQEAVIGDLLETAPATPETVARLAAEVEIRAEAARVGGWEADHIVDLVDGRSGAVQEQLLERVARARPDYMRRNAGRLPVEGALLQVPEEALAAAWGAVPLEVAIRYLRTAPAEIRARLLAQCPPRLLPGVQDELSLRVGVDPEAARSARRRIIAAVLAPGSSRRRS